MQVQGRPTYAESSVGNRGEEATARQEDCSKAKRKTEDGGNSEGVASVEGENMKGIGVVHIGEGSTKRIDTVGGITCID